MSNSLTVDETKHLVALLRRVDDPHSLHHLLGDVGTQAALQFQFAADELAFSMEGEGEGAEFGFEAIPSLAMNDASKRRLVAESEDMGYGAAAKQMPRPPCRVMADAHAAAAEHLSLPVDVMDIHDWGSTIMLVGKFGTLQKSYLQLLTDPNHEVRKYCQWLEKALNEKMKPQFHDFVKYMQTARELIPEIVNSNAASSSGAGFVRQRRVD